MLSIAHGTTGALIATLIPNPIISTPLILASHFVQDHIPHWDVGQGLTSKKKSKKAAFFQELLLDFPASILLVYLWFPGPSGQINPLAFYGWFIALLPDFIEFPYLFLNLRFPLLNKFAKLHTSIHKSTPNIFKGLWPQALTLLLVYLLK
ncbi:hypothetical protein KKG65_02605 [Patescibacteria group bacterium]|nr:hypothetical protein [Patescibacteria group bacterium]